MATPPIRKIPFTAKSATQKWFYQVYRRALRWWAFDLEYQDHMPESQNQYRPRVDQWAKAKIPTQQFIRDFHIKYYKRDYRLGGQGDKDQDVFKIIWRDELLENPMRLQKGETVGPFYGFGQENRVVVAFDETLNKQVYTYTKSKHSFKPDDRPEEDPVQYYLEEEAKAAQLQIKK